MPKNSVLEMLMKMKEELESKMQAYDDDESWKETARSITISWNTKGKMSISTENTEDVATLEVIGALDMAKFTIMEKAH